MAIIRIAPDKRYLQYRDGTSFYGVGIWYNCMDIRALTATRIKPEVTGQLKKAGCEFYQHIYYSIETLVSVMQ